MLNDVEAVFENGILRPLTPLPLAEQEHVLLTVARSADADWLDQEFVAACATEADTAITLEMVRSALSKIRGSLDDAIHEDRGDY